MHHEQIIDISGFLAGILGGAFEILILLGFAGLFALLFVHIFRMRIVTKWRETFTSSLLPRACLMTRTARGARAYGRIASAIRPSNWQFYQLCPPATLLLAWMTCGAERTCVCKA